MSKSGLRDFDEIAIPLNSTLQDLEDETIENFLNNNSNSFLLEEDEKKNIRDLNRNKNKVQSNLNANMLKSSSFQRKSLNSKVIEKNNQLDNDSNEEESHNEDDNFDDGDYQSDTDYREIDTREITKITKLGSLSNHKAPKSFQEAFPFESNRIKKMIQNSSLSSLYDIDDDFLAERKSKKQNNPHYSKNLTDNFILQKRKNECNKSLSKTDLKRIYEELDSIHNKLVVNESSFVRFFPF
jgi:hypothetical protein